MKIKGIKVWNHLKIQKAQQDRTTEHHAMTDALHTAWYQATPAIQAAFWGSF